MTDIRHIQSLNWQPRLGADSEIVTDLADIAQAIRIILATPKGSDPHRPDFGSDLWRYLDQPVTQVRPDVIRESVDAIDQWEPRASVRDVEVIPGNARLTVRVRWRPVDELTGEQTTEVAL
jgi:hypothetical protein